MPKYLLIATDRIFIPGDERSRTNPGHGYPERYEVVDKNHFFDDEESLLLYLRRWGDNIKDPVIYELGDRVYTKSVTTLSITK